MPTFALLDVVTPYVAGGAAIGQPLHELLSALFVTEIETAFDDNGICISGIARFSADARDALPTYTPPATITWNASGSVDHRTQRTAGAYWDFPDIAITFRLTAPRASSPVADLVVTGGPGGNPPALNNPGLVAILQALGQGQPQPGQAQPGQAQPGQAAADGVGTVFLLELLIDAATLNLPFLTGALLQADGMLAADPLNPAVRVTLPKIKLSLDQTAGAAGVDPLMSPYFDSWAAHDISDPAGAAYGELLRMNPPFALIGPGEVLGFGFNSVLLDLSGTDTPPELLDKFGVGDDFRGLYLPDVRVFARPPGLSGLGVDVSARELLIGLGPEGGVSGVFGLDVVKPDAPQQAVVTIYDEFGRLVRRLSFPEEAQPDSPIIAIPMKTLWVVDVSGGQPPYNISVDGQQQTTEAIAITLAPGTDARAIPIKILDVHTGGQSQEASVRVTLTAASLTAPGGGAAPGNEDAVLSELVAGPAGYGIGMQDYPGQEQVTLIFTPTDATATITRGAAASQALDISNGRASIKLAHGESVDIAAQWAVAAVPAATEIRFNAQFQYDQPGDVRNQSAQNPNDDAWRIFALSSDRIRTIRSKDNADPNGGWVGSDNYLRESPMLAKFVAAAKASPATPITLTGASSKEKAPNPDYNLSLSARRAWTVRELLKLEGVTNDITPNPIGEQPPQDGYLKDGRGEYRRVIGTIMTGGSPAGTNSAGVRIARPPRKAVPSTRKPPVVRREPAGTDDVRFKEFHLRVAIDHNRLIALEIKLKIDVATALENYLSRVQQQNVIPAEGQGQTRLPVGTLSDANDGELDMRVQVSLDDTVGRWQVLASLFESDRDGLLQTPPPTAFAAGNANEAFWRNYLGVTIALTPLIDASAASNSAEGSLVALGIAAAVPLTVVGLGIVRVQRITLYGGEMIVSHDPKGTRGALLLDVEVALIVQLGFGGRPLIDTRPDDPITIRYKAIGFTTSDKPQIRDLVPVFDSSKGYALNIPSGGGINVPEPLGNIVQVMGVRIARSNPVNLELDLGLKADLGVVTVDKTTIRIPLDGGHVPSITALGVHLNIPGAIEGSGYVAIHPDGFAGQIDVSLVGLGVRIAAGLSVRNVKDAANPGREATGVLVTLEVDFPVPIALGASGLGIYGFGGLFGLHHTRTERPTDPVPALDWLTRVNGNPMDITGWTGEIDHWAIGLGAVLGTMDAGFIMNVKGMLIFEMPGPRILMVMKAKVIWIRPPRKGNPTATILAIIDVDLGRGRITIGLTFDYGIKPLLSIHVPVRAIFPFDDLPHFAIDAGTWYNPATVTFFDQFKARGYFMIRGRGIPDSTAGADNYDIGKTSPLPVPLNGFSVATGVSVSFLWGNRASGLYVSVGAAVDTGIGFEPILFTGQLRLWGELHLFVVGIEASAQLTLLAGQVPDGPRLPDPEDPARTYQPTKSVVQIDGEVSGEIDMFFFSIKGSVHVTLGSEPEDPEAPPLLVTGVSLQSRATALLQGVSSDRPIDGKLTDARSDASPIPDGEAVPIDAIIVLHLGCTPRVDGAFTVAQPAGTTTVPLGPPVGPATPAVRRGQQYYAYRIKKILLDNQLTPGAVPIVWWPNVPKPDSESKRELALLTRVPDPHPCAVERSRHAEDLLKQHWETICEEVAPPAPVLWTFHDAPLGPSPAGWILTGTAWPAPPDADRKTPIRLRLDVAETWRSGDALADLLVDIAPARIVGGSVPCAEGCGPRKIRDGDPAIAWSLPIASSADQLSALRTFLPPGVATDDDVPRDVIGCWARLLEAPFLRAKTSDLLDEHPLGPLYQDLFAQAAEQGDPLDDIVAFSTGEITALRVLLYVPRIAIESGRLIMRCFASDGTILDEAKIDAQGGISRPIATRDDLPRPWLDPQGPWRCRVEEVLSLIGVPEPLRPRRPGSVVLVDRMLPAGTSFVQFGIVDVAGLLAQGLSRPSYLVGIVETLSTAEVERHDIETEIKSHQQSEVNGALTATPDLQALLKPSTEYKITIDWEYAACDEHGGGIANDGWKTESQNFRFRTDDAPLKQKLQAPVGEANARRLPVRLDPWVILTDPDEGEGFYFHGTPIRIVFAVDYLLKMFATYGVTLEARVRAASFKNGSPISPEFAKTFALVKDAYLATTPEEINAKPLTGPAILTPWEGMMVELMADKPCIPGAGNVHRHTIVDLNLLLTPRTEFILDIEPASAPPPLGDAPATPLFRRQFKTSRYANVEEMCSHVGMAQATEFPVAPADLADLLALGAAPAPLSPAMVDAALRRAGLRPMVETLDPEIEILWSLEGGQLQPRILVIRTPEPLVRIRKAPQQFEPPNQPRLQREVVALVDKPYLEVVATEGVAGAPQMRVISQPGLNLVIVAIDSGRDKPISLSVRRHDNPLLGESGGSADIELLSMTLDAALWEVA